MNRMKNRIASVLVAAILAVSLAVPAQAAEAPSAVRVGSYKGNTLTVGEISGLMIYPSTANDSVVSSDPAVVRVGNVLGRWTATAQGPGTAVITVTAPDGRAGSVTITV
ncbi:MAG: CAP domain-containing protein, partial [Oscillospiraceae bacterium]|nr:CAP domain-containing protein [Oscillospiraceae bacterium]